MAYNETDFVGWGVAAILVKWPKTIYNLMNTPSNSLVISEENMFG